MRKHLFLIGLMLMSFSLSGCGYNTLQTTDEQINASWSEVLNQYQRRADLAPDLVSTVERYASHEREVLTRVTEAVARVNAFKATPDLIDDNEAFTHFQDAQGELSDALIDLVALAENYPQLEDDSLFRYLQAQLERVESRIAAIRHRYAQAVRLYNVTVRSFPTSLTARLLGYETKPLMIVEKSQLITTPPKVDFDATPPGMPDPAAGGN